MPTHISSAVYKALLFISSLFSPTARILKEGEVNSEQIKVSTDFMTVSFISLV